MAPVYSNLAVLLIVMSNVGATQTLEEAFATGVLMAKNGGIVCACSPDKHYPATWGPRSSEWRGRVASVLSSRTADAWLPGPKRHRNEPKWYERPPAAAANEMGRNYAEVCQPATFRHVCVPKTFRPTSTRLGPFQSHTSWGK